MNRFILKDPLYISGGNIEGYISESNCWICDSHAPNANGRYYSITRRVDGKRKRISLHRYTFENYVSEIPEGLVVRHKCDNVFCINPDHLELGTYQDNSNDMKNRNRTKNGESNHSSKLTINQIEEIRLLLKEGILTQKQIGEQYDVTQRNISYIKNNKIWA